MNNSAELQQFWDRILPVDDPVWRRFSKANDVETIGQMMMFVCGVRGITYEEWLTSGKAMEWCGVIESLRSYKWMSDRAIWKLYDMMKGSVIGDQMVEYLEDRKIGEDRCKYLKGHNKRKKDEKYQRRLCRVRTRQLIRRLLQVQRDFEAEYGSTMVKIVDPTERPRDWWETKRESEKSSLQYLVEHGGHDDKRVVEYRGRLRLRRK